MDSNKLLAGPGRFELQDLLSQGAALAVGPRATGSTKHRGLDNHTAAIEPTAVSKYAVRVIERRIPGQ
jgi:hypothetical protein